MRLQKFRGAAAGEPALLRGERARAQSGRAGSVAPRGKRSRDEAASDRNLGLPDQLMEKMEVAFQSAKLRETYTWKWKKFEGFGESFVPFPKVVM